MMRMRQMVAGLLVLLLCGGLLAACKEEPADETLKDGVYTAEFKEYDHESYKDFIIVEVQGGVIVSVVYDAKHKDDDQRLKTADSDYEKRMQSQQETYPAKYTADLVNQLLETGSIDSVDDVAGATWSSESFRTLYRALVPQMIAGDTSLLLVDNVAAK